MNRQNKKLAIVLICLLANLTIAIQYALAAIINGQISIEECTSGCLTLSTPLNLSLTTPQDITNQAKNLYLYSQYDLGDEITIKNTYSDHGFDLSVVSTDLTNTSPAGGSVPHSKIGLLTFNNTIGESIDAENATPDSHSVISLIDPVETGRTSDPFNQTTLNSLITGNTDFANYYTYFPSDSSPINIISSPANNNSFGYFHIGLSAIIKIPDTAIRDLGIRDGHYVATLTFTLTPNG